MFGTVRNLDLGLFIRMNCYDADTSMQTCIQSAQSKASIEYNDKLVTIVDGLKRSSSQQRRPLKIWPCEPAHSLGTLAFSDFQSHCALLDVCRCLKFQTCACTADTCALHPLEPGSAAVVPCSVTACHLASLQ